MKYNTLSGALIALLHTPAVLAQATETSVASTTPTVSVDPTCTASEIASLCDYPEPGVEFAVASSGRASCWDYCNEHSPCSFVIFVAGNPYTGTGTCWLYPGESFDASLGNSDCDNPYLTVYDQPVCAGASSTSGTSDDGACAATATPSAVASVCGYPPPDEDCFYDCFASEGAVQCLSLCAEQDACSYVVFNPNNPSNTPYSDGNCWVYQNGTYDSGSTTTCSSDPEQYVYNNLCPKPSPSSSPPSSEDTSSSSPSPSAGTDTSGSGSGTGPAGANAGSNPNDENSAPNSLSVPNFLVVGMAMLVWQGF